MPYHRSQRDVHSETTKSKKNHYVKKIIKTYLKHFFMVYSNYSSKKCGFFSPESIVKHRLPNKLVRKKNPSNITTYCIILSFCSQLSLDILFCSCITVNNHNTTYSYSIVFFSALCFSILPHCTHIHPQKWKIKNMLKS